MSCVVVCVYSVSQIGQEHDRHSDLAAIQFHTDPLPHNFPWEDSVLKDDIVHCCGCGFWGDFAFGGFQLKNWHKNYDNFPTTSFDVLGHALRSEFMSSSSSAQEMPDLNSSGFSPLDFPILALELNMASSLQSRDLERTLYPF
ncbi:hypothetical protein STEG23_007370 [Scotinomys teguina]